MPQINTKISDETLRQIRYLRENHGYSLRDVMTLAVQTIYDRVKEANMTDNCAWTRYLGDQVTPAEYLTQHGAHTAHDLIVDLTDLWGDHPTERMNPNEIVAVAARLYNSAIRPLLGG